MFYGFICMILWVFACLSYLFSFRYLICYQTSLKHGTGDAVNSSGYKQITLFLQIVRYTLVWPTTKWYTRTLTCCTWKVLNPRSYINTAQQQYYQWIQAVYVNNGFTNNEIRNLYCKWVYYTKYSSLVKYQH